MLNQTTLSGHSHPIGEYTFEEYLDTVESFHGYKAPGVVIGDLTEIVPGESKGPVFKKGQVIGAGDLCQLHRMGKQNVYIDDGNGPGDGWVHENGAALAFAGVMAGKCVTFTEQPREGKINFLAAGCWWLTNSGWKALTGFPGWCAPPEKVIR